MKEQITNPLEQAFADMLAQLIKGVEKGADFLNAQLPEVVEQLLMWKMYESIIGCVMGVLLVAFSLGAPVVVYKKFKKIDIALDEVAVMLGCIFGGTGLFLLFVAGICEINFKWLQILIAPKIYLIEYASELIK